MEAHTRSVKNEVRKKYGLLPPEEIARIRHKLELTQGELEEVLGTGAKVIVRWESGKVIQGSGYDNMLRLLDRDPRIIKSLRQIQEIRSTEKRNYERGHARRDDMVAHAGCR
jgi:putative zinc finger/helix-turn-helix YgiT family protein